MVIDCDSCQVRGLRCSDCVVTAFLGQPSQAEFDGDDVRALSALAQGGLVAPLRLVPVDARPDVTKAAG